MLRLKNVSKFYYNKGVIASGFNKVNISFDIGEFVVITGESGSGKSTLLNVISGLDSYEEGEMYINGIETSHYGKGEMDEYRKKYVSNIFQHFNLVNSYTVYQNVELVFLMNGYKKRDVKKKILDLIEQVGLTKYKNTKVSKLSGGQKQRVAIARALGKETPIIVCDEPTANLDSKSSREIIKILKEISKNKLVIMVTHDNTLVDNIATRVVKMNDGKIVSDKKLVDCVDSDNVLIVDNDVKNMGLFNMIRLGIRNTFNIKQKFILLFIVFFFITTSLLTVYGSLRKGEYESSKLGTNYYFSDTSDTRIIINKKDGSSILDTDFDKISKINNVDYIEKRDILLDNYLWFESTYEDGSENYYVNGIFKDIDRFNLELDYGRMPKLDNEVIILTNNYYGFFSDDNIDKALSKTYYLNSDKNNIGINIVGVKYIDEDMFRYTEDIIYGSEVLLDSYLEVINVVYSDIKININNKNYSYNDDYSFMFYPSDRVSRGNAIVSENINYTCKDYNCKNKDLRIDIDNLYYSDSIGLKISNTYNSKNVDNILGINKDNNKYGAIFINKEDYDSLFNKDSYQASIFASRVDYVDDVSNELEKLGFDTMEMRLSLNNDGENVEKVIKILKLVVIVVLVITLFFISYFVIKLILKSRNIYFSTLRILGGRVKNIKRILDIELFVNSSLAYLSYILIVLLVKYNILEISFIKNMIDYLYLSDYIFMYLILIFMSYLISSRYASKLFKDSAMNSYREEV